MTDIDPKERANKLQADPMLQEGPRGPRWTWIAIGLIFAIVIVTVVTVTTDPRQTAQRQETRAVPMTTGSSAPTEPVIPSGRTSSGAIPATPPPQTR